MSISNLSLVNQKLAFANAILINMELSAAQLTGAQKIHQQALKDAVIFHLFTALCFYVRELADQYRVKAAVFNTVDELYVALGDVGLNSSETNELMTLKEMPGSWLHSLLFCEQMIFKSPVKAKEKKAFILESTIELVDAIEIDQQESLELTRELLMDWLNSFRDMLSRHRNTYAEY